MSFQITRAMDVGTGNPIVARLSVGLFNIIQMVNLPDEEKENIKTGCFDIMRALVEAEKAARPLMDEIKSAENVLANDGVKVQEPSKTIETPDVMNLENAAIFLKFAKRALQILAKTMGVLLKKDFNGPHFDKVRDRAMEILGVDHVVSKLLQEDHSWLKQINDLRIEDEHPKSGKPFVRGFNITRRADGKFLIETPRFFDDTQILSALEVYSHNLLTFAEEMIALTLSSHFPPPVTLYEIPEEQRTVDCPVRFRLGLKDGVPIK